MRDAKRYRLIDARESVGKAGKKDSSMWFPDRVAGWLIDKKHMELKAVVDILRAHFPECSEAADMLDPANE